MADRMQRVATLVLWSCGALWATAQGGAPQAETSDGDKDHRPLARRAVRPSDLARITHPLDLEVRADGAFAVVALRQIAGDPAQRGAAEASYQTHLEWVPLAPSDDHPLALTHGPRGGRGPAVAPGGAHLAFLRPGEADASATNELDRNLGLGVDQVWVLPLVSPGEARQITRLKRGATRVDWNADGTSLWVWTALDRSDGDGSDAPGSERPRLGAWPQSPSEEQGEPRPDEDLDEVRRWLSLGESASDPALHTRISFQGEQRRQGEPEPEHILRVNFPFGTHGVAFEDPELDLRDGAPSPSGEHALAIGAPPGDRPAPHPDRVLRRALWLLTADPETRRVLWDDPRWDVRRVRWHGSEAALVHAAPANDRAYGQVALFRVELGGEVTRLAPGLDRSISELAVRGNELFARVESEGDAGVWQVPLDGSPPQPWFVPADSQVSLLAAAADCVVLVLSTPNDPARLVAVDSLGNARDVRRWHADLLAEVELSLPVEHSTRSPDGTAVPYWVIEPLGVPSGGTARTLLSLHGGPAIQWGPATASMWHEWQMFAARGFGVVFVNPRGSHGYGRAFQAANWRDWGAGPAADALAALDDAARRYPWIREDRLYLTGGSYAGYLTAWIVAHDRRFRAAAAQRGVYHLPTAFGEANAWRLLEDHFGPFPWDPPTLAALEANSPFVHAQNIHTPLLILHADQDLRTGVSQSEMLYRALKVLDRPVEYVRYPLEGHELSRSGLPRRRLDRLFRLLEWFERFDADLPADAEGPK